MKLEFLPLDKLSISRANMRVAKKAPDVADILPSVRQRGVLQPVIVRANGSPDTFEIVAGARRFTAARAVADERRAAGEDAIDLMPCAILADTDDASAIEASLIENIARRDADEVTQWVTFTRLVKEGRSIGDIGATFGLPELGVKRILALGNLLPRIRSLYAAEEIDAATVRHLTLATKRQQQAWLARWDDPDDYPPRGGNLKSWLLGGASIPVAHALFDLCGSGLAIIADLFGGDACFADASAFWEAQNAAITAKRDAYMEAGWADAIIVLPHDHFASWEYEKTPKRKGGKVYIAVRSTGEVAVHEGYISRREAAKAERGGDPATTKPARPEVTSAMQTYIDLHRHAAVRAALVDRPGIALPMLLAHLIVGSPLWTVRTEPQAARDDATRESVETSAAQTRFDERRRAVLALLGMDPERETVVRHRSDGYEIARLFLRLVELPDAALTDIVALTMGETLAAGSVAVEAVGETLALDMADWWQPDAAFFDLVRDKEVLGAMVAEVAGETIAAANAKEKGATLRRIVADHLAGEGGRAKVERWVPGWLAFPPAAYTPRGGVGCVRQAATLAAARADAVEPEAPDPEVERLAA